METNLGILRQCWTLLSQKWNIARSHQKGHQADSSICFGARTINPSASDVLAVSVPNHRLSRHRCFPDSPPGHRCFSVKICFETRVLRYISREYMYTSFTLFTSMEVEDGRTWSLGKRLSFTNREVFRDVFVCSLRSSHTESPHRRVNEGWPESKSESQEQQCSSCQTILGAR